MLAEIERLKYSILVAGSHGKTTTTSLISAILSYSGLDPTVVIGGRLKATGSNARLGHGEFFIAEADESDGSFLKLSPTIALVTNIDREHLDYFRNMDTLLSAFREFMDKVPFYGASILCIEDPNLRRIMVELSRRYTTYGFSDDADIVGYGIEPDGLGMRFGVRCRGEEIGEFRIPLIGLHNVLNALGAISVGLELRIGTDKIRSAFASFSGIQRRFELKGELNGVRIFDDYGHHPTEIRATIKAIREAIGSPADKESSLLSLTSDSPSGAGRLIVVFQPHRYTRTRDLYNEFLSSFEGVDLLYLMDIYSAGEMPIEGISTEGLYSEILKRVGDVRYIRNRDEMVADIVREMREGDLILTLGAGDVWKVGEEILCGREGRENK
jgi:UDP-N-acetylmuramate--alanine ligase